MSNKTGRRWTVGHFSIPFNFFFNEPAFIWKQVYALVALGRIRVTGLKKHAFAAFVKHNELKS